MRDGRETPDGTASKSSYMGTHPRFERKDVANFLTTRCRNSELWFVNNPALEGAILGYVAKYAERYSAEIYAFAIEGNHLQGAVRFPSGRISDFMRDTKSSIARALPRFTEHPGGIVFGRRFSSEFLPGDEDLENWFFYTVLQPVQDGLVPKISEYPGYNCFHDAVWGIERKFSVVDWQKYNAAKRYNPNVPIRRFTSEVILKYKRLPGYEHLTQREYAHLMQKKLEERRQKIVQDRLAQGLGFMGREALLRVKPGSRPRHTKTSTLTSHRPRVLCVCPVRRAQWYDIYFRMYFEYREASRRYRAGDFFVKFPEGTFRPSMRACQGPPT